MVSRKNKTNKKRTRKYKRQKGGALTLQIALFTKKEVNPEYLVATLEKTFGSVTQELDKNSLSMNKIMFEESPWGYKSLPDEEKEYLYLFTLSSPPDYLSKKSCSEDDRLTRFEGEIGNALIDDALLFQLIPGPHGLYGDNFFLVGLRLGKTDHGRYDAYVRACK
jgi:hypothetical protein